MAEATVPAEWLAVSARRAEGVIAKLPDAALGPAGRLLRDIEAARRDDSQGDLPQGEFVGLRAISNERKTSVVGRGYKEPPLMGEVGREEGD